MTSSDSAPHLLSIHSYQAKSNQLLVIMWVFSKWVFETSKDCCVCQGLSKWHRGGIWKCINFSATSSYTTVACSDCGKWQRKCPILLQLTTPHSSCLKYTLYSSLKTLKRHRNCGRFATSALQRSSSISFRFRDIAIRSCFKNVSKSLSKIFITENITIDVNRITYIKVLYCVNHRHYCRPPNL